MEQETDGLPVEIENALTYLDARDAATFRRKFKSLAHDPRERDHAALELVAGVYVARLGHEVLYERLIGGLTPDWQALAKGSQPAFFADVYTFHMAEKVEAEQERQLEARGIFCGSVPPSEDRLYGNIQTKAAKYKSLADEQYLPYVVFIFGCFNAMLTGQEVWRCLHDEHGLFGLYPQLSGVYRFETIWTLEHGQVYKFEFYANERAARPVALPSGFIPRPIPAATSATAGS